MVRQWFAKPSFEGSIPSSASSSRSEGALGFTIRSQSPSGGCPLKTLPIPRNCHRYGVIVESQFRKQLGITGARVSLITAMNLKAIIALLMGLVIQFSQVQAWPAASPVVSAGDIGCCCEGIQSCPCASDRSPDQKPAPLMPAAADLKLLISRATESSLEAPISTLSAPVVATVSRAETRSAYAGVSLAVAFCRFVI